MLGLPSPLLNPRFRWLQAGLFAYSLTSWAFPSVPPVFSPFKAFRFEQESPCSV